MQLELLTLKNKSEKDKVKVVFNNIKYKKSIIDGIYSLKINLGADIVKTLNWNKKDIISVYNVTDEVNTYFLKKGVEGRVINEFKNNYYIQFRTKKIVEKYKVSNNVRYEYIEDGLKIIL